MNRHTKLLVSVLFAVIIILAAAITRFYFNVSRDTGRSSSTDEIIRKLSIDSGGNRIFEGSGGLYGIVDSSDRVIVAAEWDQLHFAEEGICLASKDIGGRTVQGCIDYDGNIAVPFIYSKISRRTCGDFVFYAAESDSDGSIVLYDTRFIPIFVNSWDSLEVSGNNITLRNDSDILKYAAGESGLTCTSAEISGETEDCEFRISSDSRIILSKLGYGMLRTVSDGVGAYIKYAIENESDELYAMTSLEHIPDFVTLFPNDSKIVSRSLDEIKSVYIYSEKTSEGGQAYSASVKARITVEYNDDTGLLRRLTDDYNASVRFVSGASGLEPVSGRFLKEQPDYPVPNGNMAAESSEDEQQIKGGTVQ
ncbi:MAG: WG repeat-containing protein [Ruminococcus sp.]|nr:WG repeat-containing protein [Oscillospiraceae bacterium]